MDEEIDCKGTSEVVCPYCGYETSDSYEHFRGQECCADIECDECGKKFEAAAQYSVEYSTSKDCDANKEPHDWKEITFCDGGSYGTLYYRNCKVCNKQQSMNENGTPKGRPR